MKLHHYGFATKSIEKSLKEFERIGYHALSEKIIDPIQKVELLFINNENNHPIELVAPLDGNESPVSNILKKSGPILYHICYEVENIEKSIAELKTKHFVIVVNPTPAIAFNMKKVCFLYNSHIGLIEILEK